MVKFAGKPASKKTTNKEGGVSYKLTPKETITQIVPTLLMGEPKFYGDVQKVLDKALDSVAKTDPEFILKLASFTRNEMYLRTVSIYLLVKAANLLECKPFVRKWSPYIIKRADEIKEAFACHRNLFSERGDEAHSDKPLKLPNSLKKGIADTFKNFDEYQFAKWG